MKLEDKKERKEEKRGKLTIREWEKGERPREKFLSNGGYTLSNAELIALIIRSGNNGDNAVELARKLLHKAGNSLTNLRKFGYGEYKSVKGIGTGKALGIMAAFEIAKRTESENFPDNIPIYNSSDAARAIAPALRDLKHEECWVLYLNRNHKLLGKERISVGGINATVVDLRIIIKQAIEKLASGIILVHNHPSGNEQAGEQDKIQTMKLKKAAELCDIQLIDHIIIAGDKYSSFIDEGLL